MGVTRTAVEITKDNIKAQQIARETMSELNTLIRPGMSEKHIETLALRGLTQRGSTGWWYHGVGALVLLGERSRVSTSGSDYFASEENILKENDVVTVDLAPTVGDCWGDYARTIFVENGMPSPEDKPSTPEYRDGVDAQLHLHAMLMDIARPDMTLENVFELINEEIDRIGFVNLDFKKNLGHTIEVEQGDRVYLEKGSRSTFAELAKPFTLEPHIARKNGDRGFKRENIYYFEGDELRCL